MDERGTETLTEFLMRRKGRRLELVRHRTDGLDELPDDTPAPLEWTCRCTVMGRPPGDDQDHPLVLVVRVSDELMADPAGGRVLADMLEQAAQRHERRTVDASQQ